MARYNVTLPEGSGVLTISPSVTMGANEQPQTFEWTNSLANGMFQRLSQGTGSTLTFGICDTSGNNKHVIFTHYDTGGVNYFSDNNELTSVSAADLKGKSLAFYVEGQYWSKRRDWDTIAINTTTSASSYSITVTATGGHGTASANVSSAYAGTIITLTATPASGYRLARWVPTPSSLVITNNTFTMPSSAVTINAEFEVAPNNVILNQYPFCRVTADKTTNVTPNTTVTLTATVDNGYQLTGWTSVPSVTFTGNTFKMPSSDITVTPVLQKTSGTVVHAGYYDNAIFNPCIPMYYNGSSWIECVPKYYDGTSWIDATTT